MQSQFSSAPRLVHAQVTPQTDHPVSGTHSVAPAPVGVEASTPIQTPDGIRLISALTPGDLVSTRGGGTARVMSIDSLHLSVDDLHRCPDAAPIRFDPNTLPGMANDVALLVSGNLPVHVPPPAGGLESITGNNQFPAKAFCDGGSIRAVIPEEGIRYVNLHLDGTHQICAAGVWVEADASVPITHLPRTPSQSRVRDIGGFHPLH